MSPDRTSRIKEWPLEEALERIALSFNRTTTAKSSSNPERNKESSPESLSVYKPGGKGTSDSPVVNRYLGRVREAADKIPHNEHPIRLPRNKDPWAKYSPILNLQQGNRFLLSQSKFPSENMYAIRIIEGACKDKHFQAIQQLQIRQSSSMRQEFLHRNICHILEMFDWDDKLFVVEEYVEVSIFALRSSPYVKLREDQVAFIAQAMVSALVFLFDHGIAHGSVNGEYILIGRNCIPRLAHPSCWQSIAELGKYADSFALANVVVQMMDKFATSESHEAIDISDPAKCSREVLDFIGRAREQSPQELQQHQFLKKACEPYGLFRNWCRAYFSASRFWDFEGFEADPL